MKTSILAILIALTPVVANAADLGQQCAAAYEAGDTAETSRIIPELTTGRHVLSEAGILAGRYCIESVLGVEYEFNRMKGLYEKVDVEARAAEQARRKAEEQKRQEAAQSEERAQQAATEAKRRVQQDAIDELNRKIAQQKAEREDAVWEQTSIACTRLYKRKPDEALLTTVCRSLFLEAGLPE